MLLVFYMFQYKFLQSDLICGIHHHFVELNSCWEYIIRIGENIWDVWLLGCPSIMFFKHQAEGNDIPVTDEDDDMCVSVA